MRIRTLAAADLDALLPALASLMIEVVADGASIGFHPPLAMDDAEGFWRGIQSGAARGERVVLGAFDDAGTLAGTGQLALASLPNSRHRAEVQKLMVAPSARRRGIARALMLALEAEARAAGRTLLLLDTREGDPAATLYRDMGWTLVGPVPGYVREVDGRFHATLVFYRSLG